LQCSLQNEVHRESPVNAARLVFHRYCPPRAARHRLARVLLKLAEEC
jgi:hypothetical protein